MESIRDLLVDEMRDLYDAEKQLVKALPKMAKAASNAELSDAIENHLEETRGHVQRLEQGFEMLGVKAKSKSCEAMKGLIKEGGEAMKQNLPDPLRDSAIICAAQKVEHYEMAGYGTLRAWANALGLDDVAGLLDETLGEEEAADQKLTDVAGGILSEAASLETGADTSEAGSVSTPGKKSGAGRTSSASKTRRRAS